MHFSVRFPRLTDLWRLDSPRKWLVSMPFTAEAGITAYRRFEISALLLEGEGVAFAVDVSTAFLTNQDLGYFFRRSLSPLEKKEREATFNRLTLRQKGQKGTLVYDLGETKRVCYFEKADPDRTCATTPELRIDGRTYTCLHDYYSKRNPHLKIGPNEPAVLVSFRGIEHPVWVAARLLRVRVMNDSLPDSLASVDKIPPAERLTMIEEFWSLLGEYPFGALTLKLAQGFWRPGRDRILTVQMPSLEFNNGHFFGGPLEPDPRRISQVLPRKKRSAR